jgi:formyltetrahydrofolate synthetase
LETSDPEKVRAGADNLIHHINAVGSFGVPVVVAINQFGSDSPEELEEVRRMAMDAGATAAVKCSGFAQGGDGATDLADAVANAVVDKIDVNYAYSLDDSVEDKVLALAKRIYGADDVSWSPEARRRLRYFEAQGWGNLPICMAKTHLSISHDPSLKGSPRGYTFPISDIRASVGAGFLFPLAGTVATLPGLPSKPRALNMDVAPSGEIIDLS